MNGTRVLVAGAAGLIGRAVTDNLLACGIAVTALVLHDPGDLAADRVVVGDASDPDVVRTGLADVEAVVHLAAMPSPNHGTAFEVFGGNTQATFVVLEEAGNAGVRRAVIASSYSILGLPWSPRTLHPAYLPIDEQLPLQIEDPYGLSKLVDEKTAEMMSCRHGMDIMALRFPFVSNEQRQRHRLEATIADPAVGAAEVWSYLDVRDAAEACRLAITVPSPGYHAVFLAAPQTLAPFLTEELIAAYHPQSQLRRRIPRRDVPIDLSAAEDLLGFRARHLVDLDVRPLPDTRPYA